MAFPTLIRNLCRHKSVAVSLVVIVTVVCLAVLAPWVAPHDPNMQYFEGLTMEGAPLPPNEKFLLGTDLLGRDLLSRLIYGAQTSLIIGVVANGIAIFIGTLVGVCAGFIRGWTGAVLMRLTDLFLSLPLLPLLLVMVLLFREALNGIFGPEMGIFILIVVAIGATSWMPTARIVRGDVLALKEREFILAARSIGTTNFNLITRHILPNVMSPIMVSATLGIANAIITESALSFLGLGFPPDFPTWGRLLNDATQYLTEYPERVFWPGLAISLTVLAINYMGDGMRDALDPRIRGR